MADNPIRRAIVTGATGMLGLATINVLLKV